MNKQQTEIYNQIVDLDIPRLTDEQVEFWFSKLLEIMPNNGKLYKYRNIQEECFQYTFDALKKGYIYLSTADTMNDKLDSTIRFDVETEKNSIIKFFIENKEECMLTWIKLLFSTSNLKTSVDDNQILAALNCFTSNGRFIKSRARELLKTTGADPNEITSMLNLMGKFVEETVVDYQGYVQSIAEKFIGMNFDIRKNTYLFCMSEKYNLDSMWAYYGDNNRGFCIEYDYNKALKYPKVAKQVLLTTRKVKYSKSCKSISFVPIIREIILNKRQNKEIQNKLSNEFMEQLITKNKEWLKEKEWRIIVNSTGHEFNVDLASAIYIDESVYNTDKVKKLMQLANQRDWNVYIRRVNVTGNGFIYQKVD